MHSDTDMHRIHHKEREIKGHPRAKTATKAHDMQFDGKLVQVSLNSLWDRLPTSSRVEIFEQFKKRKELLRSLRWDD